ncbi:MAG: Mov34/MPN/PAD-1 family protein [Proteobacteria bacterium]|nr:Mov34/MPN/PAD-1 family protein [Pseudomonadota bacterium]
MELRYTMVDSGQVLVLSDAVVKHIVSNRQSRSGQAEAGGQLFATFEDSTVLVTRATGPRKADHRSRFCFIPHRVSERREIKQLFKAGLHFVGDWHTHPQSVPRPSEIDLSNISDMFAKSRHGLAGFVLIIAGTEAPPHGLCVAICDERQCTELAITEELP